jgi:hypothetical protein
MGGFEDPAYKTFDAGWARWVRDKSIEFPYVYWNPKLQDWRNISRTKLEDTGLGTVSVDSGFTFQIYGEVRRTWSSFKDRQPTAVWNPRNGRWLVGPPAPGVSTNDPRLVRMREELALVDAAFASGDITADQRDEQKDQIIDRYL